MILDTHVILWILTNQKLPVKVSKLVIDKSNKCFVTRISLIEMALKSNLGKLEVNLEEVVNKLIQYEIEIKEVTLQHLKEFQKLPQFEDHKDPFDRLMISMAISDGIPIISKDQKFSYYKHLVDVIWD